MALFGGLLLTFIIDDNLTHLLLNVLYDLKLSVGLELETSAVEDFAQAAFGYCAEIAAGPPEALARMKQNLQMGLHQSLDDSLLLEAEHLIESMDSDESKEAISAFMAKRPPIFSAQ